MNNYKQPGQIMEYSNSGSAISSGDPVVIGNRIGVAITDIAATSGVGSVQMEGVFELDKDGDESFTQGDALFFDSSDSTLTKTATGNKWAGYAFEAAAEAATKCRVKLEAMPKQATNVAALSQDISSSYTEAEVQAISTKVDAILTALKAAGLMANS